MPNSGTVPGIGDSIRRGVAPNVMRTTSCRISDKPNVATICVVAVPFVATVELVDGSFTHRAVQILLTATLLMLAGFYRTVSYLTNGLRLPLEETGARFPA